MTHKVNSAVRTLVTDIVRKLDSTRTTDNVAIDHVETVLIQSLMDEGIHNIKDVSKEALYSFAHELLYNGRFVLPKRKLYKRVIKSDTVTSADVIKKIIVPKEDYGLDNWHNYI